jgi:hypothetical protein
MDRVDFPSLSVTRPELDAPEKVLWPCGSAGW